MADARKTVPLYGTGKGFFRTMVKNFNQAPVCGARGRTFFLALSKRLALPCVARGGGLPPDGGRFSGVAAGVAGERKAAALNLQSA